MKTGSGYKLCVTISVISCTIVRDEEIIYLYLQNFLFQKGEQGSPGKVMLICFVIRKYISSLVSKKSYMQKCTLQKGNNLWNSPDSQPVPSDKKSTFNYLRVNVISMKVLIGDTMGRLFKRSLS